VPRLTPAFSVAESTRVAIGMTGVLSISVRAPEGPKMNQLGAVSSV